MFEHKPLVSVIIPTYNYAHLIPEAIDSVLNSDFPQNEIEIIVIDDGSTDETPERVKIYQERVKYLTQRNSGKAWATKVGIDIARGEYLFNLDADDLFLPNKIRKVVNIFEQDREIVHVSHPAIYWNVNDNTKVVESIPEVLKGHKAIGKNILSYLYKRKMLFGGGSTFAARTQALRTFAIPKEVDMFIDEYLVLFTLNCGYSFFIEEPLSIWRIHGNNFSETNFDLEIYQVKNQRSIASMEAVLSSLSASEFSPDIIQLYSLKNKVVKLAMKEQLEQKYLADILDLWLTLIINIRFFGLNFIKIIKNYTILNRTLPTSILKLLKQVKRKMDNRSC